MVKINFIDDINKKFATALGYPEVDRYMRKILWWSFGVFAVLAFTNAVLKIAQSHPSPFSWRVISPTEALVSLTIAFIAVLIPILLKGRLKNHYLYRVIVTIAFVTYSYLFVYISGGSIEMHFLFFIVAALLVMYADWRLGWIVLVLTIIHHGVLNYIQPGWVYFYGRNDFSVVSHALPVLVIVIFTTAVCEMIRGGVIALEITNQSMVKKMNEDKLESKRAGKTRRS